MGKLLQRLDTRPMLVMLPTTIPLVLDKEPHSHLLPLRTSVPL